MNIYEAQMDDEQEVGLTIEEFEARRTDAQEILDEALAAERLASNPDFQLIIMDRFMTREPMRLAQLMASGRIDKNTSDQCAEDIRAIGVLNSFLSTQVQRGNIAREEIEALEQAREESILNEETE